MQIWLSNSINRYSCSIKDLVHEVKVFCADLAEYNIPPYSMLYPMKCPICFSIVYIKGQSKKHYIYMCVCVCFSKGQSKMQGKNCLASWLHKTRLRTLLSLEGHPFLSICLAYPLYWVDQLTQRLSRCFKFQHILNFLRST